MRFKCPLLIAVLLAASAPAGATFHLMSIREVYVGPAIDANAQYVMLQMYASGQNQVQGLDVTFYGPTGTLLGTVTFPTDVPNGADQAYILIATTEAVTRFGVAADLAMTPLLNPAGGKVCFESVDCFSWGTYSGNAATPSPSGTPFNAAGGLTADTAVTRDISTGTPTLIEAGDDTDDSAADFDFAAAPDPQNNPPDNPPGGGGGGGGGGALSPMALVLLLLAWSGRRGGPGSQERRPMRAPRSSTIASG